LANGMPRNLGEEGVSNLAKATSLKLTMRVNVYSVAWNGNVYNLNVSFLEDAKRRNNGSQKTARSQTRFACIFA